jgi:hypothetical protein
MYKQNQGVPTPQANLAINKSRLKLYGKNSKVPTYYLSKGQEFQIELFNPTKDTVLAKIFLNGKPIAQGGLVLRPAERVFLERYIDVAKKFKFETYEVANTSESRKAIEDNGDFKVEFYKEQTYRPHLKINPIHVIDYDQNWRDHNSSPYCDGSSGGWANNTFTGDVNDNLKGVLRGGPSADEQNMFLCNASLSDDADIVATAGIASMDWLEQESDRSLSIEPQATPISNPVKKKSLKSKRSKSIETGRVAEGSHSSQKLDTVQMNWETWPFHTIEYKMLPVSQKVNTIQEVSVKKYCTNCGTKQKPTFKFCPSCGTKA